MKFESELNRYAELIVAHGLNVQPGQFVNINAEAIHRDFVCRVVDHCYKRGAKFVNVDLTDPRYARQRVLGSQENDLTYVPRYVTTKYTDLVDETAANLKIVGSEEPDILADLSPQKVNTARVSQYKAVKYFYDEGIGKSKVHWTVVAASTPKWAQKIFPKDKPEEACSKLWEQLFKICRADKENCLSLWKEHNDRLHRRAKTFTELGIKDLHFVGPGTDLHVGLSPRALFKGGGDVSPRGVEFEPNLPTEEVFTTPDYRMTSGHVQTTRPFMINGVLIKDLKVEFENGVIKNFSASQGKETFSEYSASDEGGRRLGEVALVGIDSPIYQSGLVFNEILLDENAACHIAIGSAYKFCLKDGATLSKEEIAAVGCNESSVHTDMMISSEQVDVTAHTYAGASVPLIKKGRWVEQFQ